MKILKQIYFILLGAMIFVSCTKTGITDLQTDPNNPTSVPANLILVPVLENVAGNSGNGDLGGIMAFNDVQKWNQYYCENYDYYGNNIYSWTNFSYSPYLVLNNVAQMEKKAVASGAGAVNPYEAIGKFVRAYYYYNMSYLLGDIPMTDALGGSSNFTPTYTSQAQVFKYVLNILDTANTHFATLISKNDNSLPAAQDLFYQGSLSKWQKLVNSFKLRVLLALSKKSSDATLNIPAQFAAIVSNPSTYPVFTSQSDDMEFTYDATYNQYPLNPNQFGSTGTRKNMAATYVSACTSIQDPRIFVTAEPAWSLAGSDANPAQFNYFVGASTGEPVQTMYGNASANKYSFINRKKYWSTFVGEPYVLIGYKELCFNIAEGIARGWASGNAESFYKKGIVESMNFYGIDTTKSSFQAYFLTPGTTDPTKSTAFTVNFNFNTYYNQSAVKLSGTQATAISQIITQKYIAMFQSSGYEGYYNWRRTGIPTFLTGSGIGNNGIIPLRWAYPTSEQNQNATNYKAALTSQGFTADDLNQTMWLLK